MEVEARLKMSTHYQPKKYMDTFIIGLRIDLTIELIPNTYIPFSLCEIANIYIYIYIYI